MSRTIYNNPTFELHFLLGLPASGKSYWARNNFNTNTFCNHTGDFIIDLDKYMHDGNGKLTTPVLYGAINDSDMKYYVGGELQGTRKVVKVCFDGLITNIDDLSKIIDYILDYIKNRYKGSSYEVKLYIHQWNEDRETCIHNDKMRVNANERKDSSEITIHNHPYEYIKKEQLAKYRENNHVTAIKFERHVVKKITLYDTIFVPYIGYDIEEDRYSGHNTTKTRYMYSESWSGGGSWCDCWGNEDTISADKPNEFDELDNLLEKLCPGLTLFQYKRIKKECVEIEETREYDYYGGCEYRQRWKCDMEKLYEILKEMNLINDYGESKV